MIRSAIILFFVFSSFKVFGQEWQLIKQVNCGEVDKLTLDDTGNIYVASYQGEVVKYSPEGKLLVEFAPLQVAGIHEITAPTQFKVFLFYKDLQEYVILNRYLSNPLRYRLPDFDLGYIEDVAPNLQQALWVLDISDFALKLIDLRENRLLEQKSLAKVLDQNLAEILSFHSHHNRMYVMDEATGVHVFDNIGNYLFKLMDDAPVRIGFYKDFMYYKDGDKLKLIHLYGGEDSELSLGGLELKKVGFTNNRLVGVTSQGFNIYQYLSGQ